jgi:predicted enzyme related to lactoylglutathione lyase
VSEATTGKIVWFDLTVSDAEQARDFYASVVGWQAQPVGMGDYDDFGMDANGETVAGICHARGVNAELAELPPRWMAYIAVDDLDASLERCRAAGGATVTNVRDMGDGTRFCVIRDPAGAVVGLIQLASA